MTVSMKAPPSPSVALCRPDERRLTLRSGPGASRPSAALPIAVEPRAAPRGPSLVPVEPLPRRQSVGALLTELSRWWSRFEQPMDLSVGIYHGRSEPVAKGTRRTFERLFRTLRSRSRCRKRLRVLHLDAGMGTAARWIVRRRRWTVTCLGEDERLNEANRRASADSALRPYLRVMDGRAEHLPFAARSFDVVWWQEGLAQHRQPAAALAEIGRVLEPGGELLFTEALQLDGNEDGRRTRFGSEPPPTLSELRDGLDGAELGAFAWRIMPGQLADHLRRVVEPLRLGRSKWLGTDADGGLDELCARAETWSEADRAGRVAWALLRAQRE